MLLHINKENRLSGKMNSLIQGYMNLFCFSENNSKQKRNKSTLEFVLKNQRASCINASLFRFCPVPLTFMSLSLLDNPHVDSETLGLKDTHVSFLVLPVVSDFLVIVFLRWFDLTVSRR